MIAITFALPAESRDFLRSLNSQSRVERNGISTIRGEIDHRTVEVLHTGVGEKVCRQRIDKFLQDQRFDYLISAGFAGALNDALQVGDLVLAKNFSTVELGERWSSVSSLPIYLADLLTVPDLIDSGEQRVALAHTSGADAVDMETEFIARACAKLGVPLLSLRVISDTPSELFPAPAHVLFDVEQQRTRMPKLAAYLLAHPNRVPRLVRFARRIAHGRKTLTTGLMESLRALLPAA
jgi:nucleoside phosphorylase